MGSKSKDAVKTMVAQDMLAVYNRSLETRQAINDSLKNVLEFMHTMIAQIPHSANGPLIPKTPKAVKKKGVQRIETIPEDDVVEYPKESISIKQELNDTESIRPSGRVKRQASKKAETNIRQQQSLNLLTKLRRPASNEFDPETKTKKRESRTKRKKSLKGSSDEEDSNGPAKHSRIEETMTTSDTEKHYAISNETVVLEQKKESPMKLRNSDRKRSASIQEVANDKTYNMGDDTLIAPVRGDIDEPLMYEDAMSKPVPIMNSTMNLNGPTLQNMMNATVVLEPLSNANLNTTVTIQKKSSRGSKNTELETQQKKSLQANSRKSPRNSASLSTGKTLPDRKQEEKLPIVHNIDDLITDDESSPEVKKTKYTFKKPEDKKKRRKVQEVHSSSDDDSITPPRKIMRAVKNGSALQDTKNGYKSNALFSPYAKESVKKRVEAFEQAGLNSPKAAVDIDAPTRLTRTKTRALAAAQAEAGKNVEVKEKSITQKLARKSLAKAKKISLAKEFKDTDDYKENLLQSVSKPSRLVSNDKASSKQNQKTTPLGKTKTLLPMSVNRLQHTPSNHHIPHTTKALSATRSNVVMNMDSFIQPKVGSKSNSVDKQEERRRKMNEEDAKKKREEALRQQTEEKKRKREEKELKNKLAREAKERLEMEKRLKAEKEKEEKARLVQQQIDKQREEMEKKRLLQIQRMQEKEEKRRLEEQHRQLRLREQEEAERGLAEQRRREQEAERRREAEARAQQQAAAEAMRLKQQMLAAQAKHHAQNKKHEGPTNYILDSEPDDDESDDESRPKHAIPYWSQPHVRKCHLEMQRYIPMNVICKFFDAKKSTPDLTEFFHGIDRNRLKRTSSAIWKTPPRYSMME